MTVETEFLVLGGGIAGLAAAAGLGPRAVVLERDDRPGGLVRTDCLQGYWFDHVLHLLHFGDPVVQARVQRLLGEVLAPCPPVAWIECEAGTVRYPFQLNLGALEHDAAVQSLTDFARACFGPQSPHPPGNYQELLLRGFGETICRLFLLPYNRKMWRRPLDSLAAGGFVWNVARPGFEEALEGMLRPNAPRPAYNANAFYPRPRAGSPLRGMEVLSRALADRVENLHLETTVEAIDPAARRVTARRGGEPVSYRYTRECLCTLPLPAVMRMCAGVPAGLAGAVETLRHNLVLSVFFAVRGPRPASPGLWRYYTDESVPFTRLVFMHELDPLTSPPEGWGLIAEITHPAECPRPSEAELLAAARAGVRRVGALPAGCEIVFEHLRVADPAYVVFTPGTAEVVRECRDFLAARGVRTVGRYGRWEYSSMAQVMGDAFAWADGVLGADGAS